MLQAVKSGSAFIAPVICAHGVQIVPCLQFRYVWFVLKGGRRHKDDCSRKPRPN